MAIQNRRGSYQDFDPTKMVEGEFAFVLSDDPAGSNGQSVYASFKNGSAKRMATYEDMQSNIDSATSEIQQTLTDGVDDAIADAQTAVSGMRTDIDNAIANASSSVSDLEGDVASAISQAQTDISTIQTDYQSLKSNNANQLYTMQNTVNTAIDDLQGTANTATAAANYAVETADEIRQIIETGGTVASVFGRTGSILAEAGDYNSTQITHNNTTVAGALDSKQNILIPGNGINITNNVISADIGSLNIPDPHNVFYGGTITAQGQGILAAIGAAHNAIEITAGAVFDVQYPLLYAPDEIENLTTGTGDTLGIYAIYGTATTPSDITSPVAYAPIYVVGTVSGTGFTVDSTTPYTQTLPNSEDGKVYMLVGNTGNSGSSFVFSPSEKLFAYMDGAIQVISPYALRLATKYVAKSGDTMTGTLEVGRVAGGIKFKANTTNMTAGVQPSSTLFGNELLSTDSSSDQMMRVTTWQGSGGALSAAFSVRNRQSAGGSWNSWNQIQLSQDMNGTNHVSVTAPAAWRSALDVQSLDTAETSATNRYTRYMKFEDGSLICMVEINWTGKITTAYGSMFYNDSAISCGNWPVAFTGIPYMSVMCTRGIMALAGPLTGTSKTAIGTLYIYRPSANSTSSTYYIDIIAYGRWK